MQRDQNKIYKSCTVELGGVPASETRETPENSKNVQGLMDFQSLEHPGDARSTLGENYNSTPMIEI